ncbi:hypothetical protein KIPB_002889 [Kipferlia bialata]|uniref:Uncharacterized protein n=1 Tax=Kipferlia bialata TaxID=797122 RepID=A0A9K3CRM2_9EUKA|nr:hypothetical protein KIPB_002889 [Kipferlia bialata]|eukprot:g2889.t1
MLLPVLFSPVLYVDVLSASRLPQTVDGLSVPTFVVVRYQDSASALVPPSLPWVEPTADVAPSALFQSLTDAEASLEKDTQALSAPVSLTPSFRSASAPDSFLSTPLEVALYAMMPPSTKGKAAKAKAPAKGGPIVPSEAALVQVARGLVDMSSFVTEMGKECVEQTVSLDIAPGEADTRLPDLFTTPAEGEETKTPTVTVRVRVAEDDLFYGGREERESGSVATFTTEGLLNLPEAITSLPGPLASLSVNLSLTLPVEGFTPVEFHDGRYTEAETEEGEEEAAPEETEHVHIFNQPETR